MSRAKKLRNKAVVNGQEFFMSNSDEAQAINALASSSGGGGSATGYPQITTKVPVHVASGGSIQNGDAIIAIGGSYTFAPDGWGFDEWTAQFTDTYNPKTFSGNAYSPLFTTSHGALFEGTDVSAEPLQIIGMYNGPTILDPGTDPTGWVAAGGDTDLELILVDCIMSGEAEYIPVNEYNIMLGAGVWGPSALGSVANSTCGKMQISSRLDGSYAVLPGWYVSSIDADTSTYKLQVAPGAAVTDGTNNKDLSAGFLTAINTAHAPWPTGWAADPF